MWPGLPEPANEQAVRFSFTGLSDSPITKPTPYPANPNDSVSNISNEIVQTLAPTPRSCVADLTVVRRVPASDSKSIKMQKCPDDNMIKWPEN